MNIIRIVPLDKQLLKTKLAELVEMTKDFPYGEWKDENFLLDLPKKWEFSVAAMDGEKVVGFFVSSLKPDNVFYSHIMNIRPAYQGRKIGIQLFDKAVEIATLHKMNKILFRVSTENPRSFNMFLKSGMRIIETIQDENSGSIPDYILELKIES